MMKLRKLVMAAPLLLLSFASACDSIAGSKEPDFPEVAGTYDVSAPINEFPGGRFSGTITITDDSRDTPAFTGTYALSVIYEGENLGSGSGAIVAGTVDEDGAMSFHLDDNTFRVNGTLSGEVFTGTFIITDPEGNYTGTFTASRR